MVSIPLPAPTDRFQLLAVNFKGASLFAICKNTGPILPGQCFELRIIGGN
jgi:hypothetical protein